MAYIPQSSPVSAGNDALASQYNQLRADVLTGSHHQFGGASEIVDADVSASAAISWTKISKTSADLTDLPTRDHTDLQNILGSGEYHISATELGYITNSTEFNENQKQNAYIQTTTGGYVSAAFLPYEMIFGDGSDGVATISTRTTLSSHKFYSRICVETGGVLVTNGWAVKVKNTASFMGGKIEMNGKNGNNGSNATAFTGTGAVAVAPSFTGEFLQPEPLGGFSGGHPGSARYTAGTAFQCISTHANTNTAGASGKGLSSGATSAGSTPSVVTNLAFHRNPQHDLLSTLQLVNYRPTTQLLVLNSQQSSGAGGGGVTGGGGGGNGEFGGIIPFYARIIELLTGSTYVQANGGDGGDGGGGFTSSIGTNEGGGGGGGRGGDGGLFIECFWKKVGSASVELLGGVGGIGGYAGGSTATAGQNGSNGHTGSHITYQII